MPRKKNENSLRYQTQLNIYLPKKLVISLKATAALNDKHVSVLAREIFENYLKK